MQETGTTEVCSEQVCPRDTLPLGGGHCSEHVSQWRGCSSKLSTTHCVSSTLGWCPAVVVSRVRTKVVQFMGGRIGSGAPRIVPFQMDIWWRVVYTCISPPALPTTMSAHLRAASLAPARASTHAQFKCASPSVVPIHQQKSFFFVSNQGRFRLQRYSQRQLRDLRAMSRLR